MLIVEQKSSVPAQIVNKGLGDLRFLSLTIANTNDYTLLSPADIYLGDLDSNDFSSFEIELVPQREGSLLIPVLLNYKDGKNNAIDESIAVPVKVYSAQRAQELGLVSSGNGFTIAAALVGLALIIVIYRFTKRALRKKKQH